MNSSSGSDELDTRDDGARLPDGIATRGRRRGAARRLLLTHGIAAGEISVVDDRGGGTMFDFADPDGNAWMVQQIRARGEKRLLPHVD
jgi:hypothetical protein